MNIKILQVGLGPLGIKTANFINERQGFITVAAVDTNLDLVGKDLGELCGRNSNGVLISDNMKHVVKKSKPDVALLTTVSDLERITPQIEAIVAIGLPVVTTCEELSFPFETKPDLAKRIDKAAKENKVAVIATGVNPGFLMDTLPVTMTAVCHNVEKISVSRFQDARYRRLPFQKKIGTGLSLDEFEIRIENGTLRHVGLTESMQFIAKSMGWTLDATEDKIYPVIADEDIITNEMTIKAGQATGVRQIGKGFSNGKELIRLTFQAAVGEPDSFDEVFIEGEPDVHSKIVGGVNGDIATCAIAINTIPIILKTPPGLKTMADIPPVSFSADPTRSQD